MSNSIPPGHIIEKMLHKFSLPGAQNITADMNGSDTIRHFIGRKTEFPDRHIMTADRKERRPRHDVIDNRVVVHSL